LALALAGQGKAEEAAGSHREAIRIFGDVSADHPNRPDYRGRLVEPRYHLGNLLAREKKIAEALVEYQQAVEIQEPLVAQFPSIPAYREMLARLHYAIGQTVHKEDPARAMAHYQKCLPIRTQLVEQYPEVILHHSHLGALLNNMGALLIKEGQLDDARRMLTRAVEHQQIARDALPNDTNIPLSLRNHLDYLADAMIRQQDHAAIPDVAARLAQAIPADAAVALKATRYLCQCINLADKDGALSPDERDAAKQAYADQAMEHLREAVRRGVPVPQRIKTDRLLAPLRSRSDYQQLVQELSRGME
jgi:tetratricopeptide (TPR) repeat protein